MLSSWRNERASNRLRVSIGLVATLLAACGGGGGGGGDSTPTAAAPTLTLSADRTSIAPGSSMTLSWSSSNATSCTASNGWSGSKATSGQETLTPAASATFVLTCSGAGGERSAQVAITAVAPPPVISLSASPTAVLRGAATTLTWSVTSATSCSASGAWSGARQLTGTESTAALTANATYTLNCTGAGGSRNTSLTVQALAPPTASLWFEPSTVKPQGASRVNWAATNASGCAASGTWTGARTLAGNEIVRDIPAGDSIYTLVCRNAAAEVTATAQIRAVFPALTLTDFSFVEQVSAHSSVTYVRIPGEPQVGGGFAAVTLSQPVSTVTVELVDAQGAVAASAGLSRDPDAEREQYRGPVTVPATAFHVNVSGTLVAGSTFKLEHQELFEPQSLSVEFLAGPPLTTGVATPLTVRVHNRAAAAAGVIKCGGPRGVEVTPAKIDVQFPANDGVDAAFGVLVPAPANPDRSSITVSCFAMYLDGLSSGGSNYGQLEMMVDDVVAGPFPGEVP
jgi:hypothetical protein